MRIAVIGPLEVRGDDDVPVPVPGAKERLLLAVLAAGAPGTVSTDRIADVLWDGTPPPTARKSLQAHVVRLRSALEPGRPRGSPGRYVARRGPGYALTVDRADLDALHAGDLAARGRAHLLAGAPAEAVTELSAALALWRGDPYADWPDAGFAEGERRRLAEVRTGALTGLHEARLALGQHALVLPEVERLVTEEPLREDWWRLLVLALYRAGRQADALAATRRVRALLAEELGAAPGPALRGIEAAVLAQDPVLDLPAPPPAAPDGPPPGAARCPYKGLAAYQAEDAPLFRGRARLVAGLVARLVDAPLTVVSGPSGAGKSSAVRAGLVPALGAGALPGSSAWRPVVVTPGRCPVDVLAPLADDDGPVLLVVDQAEELWAPGSDPAERTAFLDAVLGLLDDGVAARCVLVLRGDAVGRLTEHAGLTARLDGRVVLVPAFTDAELREVVREPATAVGLTVEPYLVEAVVADVLGRPSALPLLSTALVGTWERRRDGTLTLAGYLAAGGVAGALTRTAEAAWAQLDARGQALARRLLVRLADVGDGGALVRRPVPRAEFDDGDPARREVVEVFVARRLLSLDGDRLEVAHEALLTAWPRLATWLEEDAAGRAVRRRLGPTAHDWDAAGRPGDELYRGARLTAALDWADRPDADPTPVERAFLEASRAAADAELATAHRRADREAAARRRTRGLAVGLAAVLLVALVTAGVAVRAQRGAEVRAEEARRAALVADANRLATLSTQAGRLDLSLLLAAQAVRLAGTPDTEDRLLTSLVERRRVERVLHTQGGPVDGVTGGAALLLQGSEWSWWSPGDPAPRVVRHGGDVRGAGVVAGSPTEELAAVAGVDELGAWLRLVTAETDERLLPDDALDGLPVGMAFTPDGRRIRVVVVRPGPDPAGGSRWGVVEVDRDGGSASDLAVGGPVPSGADPFAARVSSDGAAVVTWAPGSGPAGEVTFTDLASARQVPLQVPRRTAATADFRAFPSGAAQLWADGAVTLYDRDGAVRQQVDAHQGGVSDVQLSPDGSWAVTVGGAPGALLWGVDPVTGLWTQREALSGHPGAVTWARIAPDGDRLFTAAPDDTVVVWDVRPDGGFGSVFPAMAGWWVAGRPEVVDPGRLAVVPVRRQSVTGGGTVLEPPVDTREVAVAFLDPATGEVLEVVPVGELPAMPAYSSVAGRPPVPVFPPVSVAVSPDRGRVAVTSGLAATVVDTRTRRPGSPIRLPWRGEVDDDGRPLPAAVVSCAEWAPDGSHLFLCSGAGWAIEGGPGLAVVDAATGRVESRPTGMSDARVSAVSADGRLLAVGSGSRAVVRILDADTFELVDITRLDGPGRIEDLAFSPDGERLVVVDSTGVVQVLDTGRGEPAGDPVRVGVPVLQADWLPDGRTVAVSALDGSVTLVGAERGLLRGPPLPVSSGTAESSLHLLTAGDELLALSGQDPGRRYPLRPEDWLAAVCGMVGRDLTPAEWEQYLPGREWRPTCTDLP
ncbi:DNA-binding SARP family transcriptional activator [Geodermatophilus normandii]|uniref:DNA-binding SARP family transcriptional activator n=1 Tax=Geodermatophilus normandii TaxID=1137989 RepID=A0A317QHT4_9ACTN|nr:BTAD domain-containing putative transcriptional regulator [Geodermatophilus normandii]PWW22892.1 DNA-binding SARP family transcriptional activator [Geodermatophilus normandii]